VTRTPKSRKKATRKKCARYCGVGSACVIDDFRINDTVAQSLLCKRDYTWVVRVHQNLKQEKLLMMMAKTSTAVFFYFHFARVPFKSLVWNMAT
jgi:hypothetical protein